jgi:NRPS condensation-like uncharacterized protein
VSANDRAIVAGPTQRLVHFMDRVSPVNFTLVADVSGALDVAAVERAVATLREIHPMLRVRLVEEGSGLASRYLFRESDARVEVRVASPGIFEPAALGREIEAELARPFDVERGPLFRVAVASDGARHRLLLAMHHMIADGASAAIVLRDLLRVAAGDEAPRAVLELPAVSGPRFPSITRVRAMLDLAGFVVRAAVHFLTRRPAGRNVTRLDAPASGRETGILLRELDEAETSALVAAAKREGATVGGLLSAAIARAVYAEAGIARPAHVAVINAVDVREMAGEGDELADHVDLLMSFVVTYHLVGDGRGLFELARECSRAVKAAVARRDAAVPHTLASLLPSIEPGEAVRATIRVADRFATSASLTNVGRVAVPLEYGAATVDGAATGAGALRLDAVRFAPSLGFMGRFAGVASTFRGRLSWNFAYVKQVVGRDLAERLAARCLADVLDGLLVGHHSRRVAADGCGVGAHERVRRFDELDEARRARDGGHVDDADRQKPHLLPDRPRREVELPDPARPGLQAGEARRARAPPPRLRRLDVERFAPPRRERVEGLGARDARGDVARARLLARRADREPFVRPHDEEGEERREERRDRPVGEVRDHDRRSALEDRRDPALVVVGVGRERHPEDEEEDRRDRPVVDEREGDREKRDAVVPVVEVEVEPPRALLEVKLPSAARVVRRRVGEQPRERRARDDRREIAPVERGEPAGEKEVARDPPHDVSRSRLQPSTHPIRSLRRSRGAGEYTEKRLHSPSIAPSPRHHGADTPRHHGADTPRHQYQLR